MQTNETSAKTPGSETLEELFEALESPLLCYALRLSQDAAVAEDFVQEAFMKLHAEFERVREPRRWLYRTVHNLALNHCRDRQKLVSLYSPQGESPGDPRENSDPQPMPDEQIIRSEGIGLVRLSLKNLDDRSRELIRLKFHEDLSYKEISAKTGLTVGNVGYLLHHAIKAVAGELAKNGIIP
jgi:RNA polymerase sigma-70 factor (ECF subfamily)